MAKLHYAVLQFEQEWKVVSGERRMGHFATQALATNAGARLAREALAAGHVAGGPEHRRAPGRHGPARRRRALSAGLPGA